METNIPVRGIDFDEHFTFAKVVTGLGCRCDRGSDTPWTTIAPAAPKSVFDIKFLCFISNSPRAHVRKCDNTAEHGCATYLCACI